MNKFKIICIVLINILLILWLLKVVFIDRFSDVVAIYILENLGYLFIYNVYALILNFLFPRNLNYFQGFFYVILLITPFFLLF